MYMRIAILTLPLHTNYGGILQAYALQKTLERMGHEVRIIEKVKKPLSLPLYKMPFSYGKRIIKNITGEKYPIFIEQKINREKPIISQYTNQFIDRYINLSRYKDFNDIKESDYDAIVVGSDQVWRAKYYKFSKLEDAFLGFTKNWNIIRISYAASFGIEEWDYTPQQTVVCSDLIKSFTAVSLREDSGVELCKKYFNIEGFHVIDPTMLLCKNDYIQLFKATETPKSNGNLLCYILDETLEKQTVLQQIINDKGLKSFNVKSKSDDINSSLSDRIQPPLEQWLRGFYDADFVFTDSFHACVFSILFNKPFIVFGNKRRGLTRFVSLLKMFGLEDCLLLDSKNYKIDVDIDWKKVNAILEDKRTQAISFLSKYLC
mgnify:CR=1 FL=1